jgi:hypothetical protein
MAYRIFMDSFSGAIGDMKPADKNDMRKVLAVLDKTPRFSCFEASERPAIANTLTDLMLSGYIEYPKPQPGFPWCRAVITDNGRSLMEESC